MGIPERSIQVLGARGSGKTCHTCKYYQFDEIANDMVCLWYMENQVDKNMPIIMTRESAQMGCDNWKRDCTKCTW